MLERRISRFESRIGALERSSHYLMEVTPRTLMAILNQQPDLPQEPFLLPDPAPVGPLHLVVKAHILRVLEANDWKKTVTARCLEINVKTLYNTMKREGIPIRRPSQEDE